MNSCWTEFGLRISIYYDHEMEEGEGGEGRPKLSSPLTRDSLTPNC
jgi:hypothetical protein